MPSFVVPDYDKVLLVDVSKWQDDPQTSKIPDFEKMKAKGVRGIIIKCGEANSIDRAFIAYAKSLDSLNIPYGVYWYYNNKYPPKKQAQLLASTLKSNSISPKLGIWLDLEDKNIGSYSGWRMWFDFLMETTINFPTQKIGIYTGYYYFVENTIQKGISKASLDWFSKFPLWIAWYNPPPAKVPKPWDRWTIWQFTDFLDGIEFGAESRELDGNYFNGTLEEFNKFFGISTNGERRLVKRIYVYSDGSQEEEIIS